ncbi:TadE-like protein [Corynebacterium aquatimens]|nr:TadE-like protein [Corynebacterium aquatimens]UIZ92327.1 TadE-like protein [Corynebacterium sp. CNCTC7651]
MRSALCRLRDDDGSATITSAGIIAAVVALAFAMLTIAAGVADQHRAAVAADLAAVAGATAYYAGADACQVADTTATLNGAQLASCEVVAGDVVVKVTRGRANAAARAGPA